MQHPVQNQNRIGVAGRVYILTSMQIVSAQRRHKAFKKKEGRVCVKGASRRQSLGKGGRKFTSGSKYCGPLKEQREEHKVGINALLMKTLMRLRIVPILSRNNFYIFILSFFLIAKGRIE